MMRISNKEIVKDNSISPPGCCFCAVPAEQDQLLSARTDKCGLKQGAKWEF